MLHQEVYALDADTNPDKAPIPFIATEQSFEVKLLQTSKGGRHGVFFAFPRETITVHTERNPTDPRVMHDFTLDIDDFGNVRRKATIAYARSATGPSVEPEQQRAWATMAEVSYINNPGASDDPTQFYRLGLPYETISYELTGLPNLLLAGQGLIARGDLDDGIAGAIAAQDVAYDLQLAPDVLGRRMIDRKLQLYYDNDPATGAIGGAAGPQEAGSLALPFEGYQLALTAGLVTALVTESGDLTGGVTETPALSTLLLGTNLGQGFYVQPLGNTGYWTRSGQIQFDAANFYLPISLLDPFLRQHLVSYE